MLMECLLCTNAGCTNKQISPGLSSPNQTPSGQGPGLRNRPGRRVPDMPQDLGMNHVNTASGLVLVLVMHLNLSVSGKWRLPWSSAPR